MQQRTALSRLLIDVARRVGGTLDLEGTLERVTRAVVELLGFEVAVLNLVTPEGELEVTNVAGPQQIRDELLGARTPRSAWEQILAASRPLGALRFADAGVCFPDTVPVWLPDLPDPAALDRTDAWQQDDALFAPLIGGDGRLLGVLSVDVPSDGLRPDVERCELLELFAVQAGLAIEQARLHHQLRDSTALFQQAFDHSPVGMAVFDADRRFAQVNEAYCTFLGRSPDELLGRRVREFSHPDDMVLSERASGVFRGGLHVVRGVEKRYLRPDGTVVWGRVSLTWLPGEGGERVLAHVEDVTLSRQAVAVLEQRASTDPLTGLANRDRLDAVLTARLLRSGPQVAVLFCDVDHFKAVNDTLGHAAGDELLQRIAAEVTAVLRTEDLAARLGGDEFVLMLNGVDGVDQAMGIADRVRLAAGTTIAVEGRSMDVTMTVGVALSETGSTARTLLARADSALYEAKQAGRDRVVLAVG